MSNILPYTFSDDLEKIYQLNTDMHSKKAINIKTIKTINYSLYFYQNVIFIDFYTFPQINLYKKLQ